MLVMDVFTPSPTPPLPVRRHPPWSQFPPLPVSESTAGLVPAPLFSKRKRLVLHVTVRDPPSYADPPSSLEPSSSSLRSNTSSAISSPATSAPNSPSNRPLSFTYEHPPPPYEAISGCSGFGSGPRVHPAWREIPPTITSTLPIRRLRRKPSPKKESLRSLRAKDSEACLQRAYDQQLEAYLSGELFARSRWREDLGRIAE